MLPSRLLVVISRVLEYAWHVFRWDLACKFLCVCAWHEFLWDLAFTSTRILTVYLGQKCDLGGQVMVLNRQVELFDVTVN